MDDNATLPFTELPAQAALYGIIGESAPMRCVYETIAKAGQSTAPVVLLGETGTGKEMVARYIHFAGSRRAKVFIPVDCSALTPTLVESELFGHVKGAFTGAVCSHRGLFRAAHEGTIFLDEIGELPMPLQAKLLRAVQEHEVRPLGSTTQFPIDDRIIAATNRDLEAEIHAGRFRQDLYYRLNVIEIRVPSLRERKSDIPLLIAHFLERFSDGSQHVRTISHDAVQRLIDCDWPGNIRQLRNAIERAVALSSDTILTVDDFDFDSLTNLTPSHVPAAQEFVSLAEVERRAIVGTVREVRGNRLAAARQLGIGKTTVYRKLKEYESVPMPTDEDAGGVT